MSRSSNHEPGNPMRPTMRERFAEACDAVGRRRHDRRRWRQCRTLRDLAGTTVAWLDGRLTQTPYHCGPPDPETAEIHDALVTLNRHGFVTVGSQPGRDPGPDGEGWWQRATVEGYTDRETATRMVTAAHEQRLEGYLSQWASAPGEPVGERFLLAEPALPCTWVTANHAYVRGSTDGGARASTGVPHHLYRSGHEMQWSRWTHLDALDALHGATRVVIVDPVWGRGDKLWDVVTAAVSRADSGALR